MEVKLQFFASALFRPARVTLLSVLGIAARAEAATTIGRIGLGCLAFRRAMMCSKHLRLCLGSSSALPVSKTPTASSESNAGSTTLPFANLNGFVGEDIVKLRLPWVRTLGLLLSGRGFVGRHSHIDRRGSLWALTCKPRTKTYDLKAAKSARTDVMCRYFGRLVSHFLLRLVATYKDTHLRTFSFRTHAKSRISRGPVFFPPFIWTSDLPAGPGPFRKYISPSMPRSAPFRACRWWRRNFRSHH
jgi:hypothetical protein